MYSLCLLTCLLKPVEDDYYDKESGTCRCASLKLAAETSTQWCSRLASSRGKHQKVVSYSLYGNSSDSQTVDRYFRLLDTLAASIAHFYPGWIMRVYHRFDAADTVSMSWLCQVYCQFSNVDLCNMAEIRNDPTVQDFVVPEDLDKLHPSLWRFLSAVDPLVDVFVSRDIDSEIIDREVAAVNQWLESKYTFHLMRDHQYHYTIILAGLWGAKLVRKGRLVRNIIGRMIGEGADTNKFMDQILLDRHLWPVAKYDIMAHDSYNCQSASMLQVSARPMFPFPTQRNEAKDFVGNIVTQKAELRNVLEPCPLACRPREHTDWEYC